MSLFRNGFILNLMRYCVRFENHATEIALIRVNVICWKSEGVEKHTLFSQKVKKKKMFTKNFVCFLVLCQFLTSDSPHLSMIGFSSVSAAVSMVRPYVPGDPGAGSRTTSSAVP